jgi:hypothetical protein
MPEMNPPLRRFRLFAAALLPAAAIAVAGTSPAQAATSTDHAQFSVTGGTLSFITAPNLAGVSFGNTTLNGQAQTVNATMPNYTVNDASGSGSGWNVTTVGNTGVGLSPVFAQYCPNATCGADTLGYKAGGATLPANSLTLNSTSASFTPVGTTSNVNAPTNTCNSVCNVDASSAVKVATAASGGGMGEWATTGFTGTSLALTIPTTAKTLQTNEVYRVDLLWTLNTGP